MNIEKCLRKRILIDLSPVIPYVWTNTRLTDQFEEFVESTHEFFSNFFEFTKKDPNFPKQFFPRFFEEFSSTFSKFPLSDLPFLFFCSLYCERVVGKAYELRFLYENFPGNSSILRYSGAIGSIPNFYLDGIGYRLECRPQFWFEKFSSFLTLDIHEEFRCNVECLHIVLFEISPTWKNLTNKERLFASKNVRNLKKIGYPVNSVFLFRLPISIRKLKNWCDSIRKNSLLLEILRKDLYFLDPNSVAIRLKFLLELFENNPNSFFGTPFLEGIENWTFLAEKTEYSTS